MPWYAIALIAYIVADRLTTVALAGRGKTIELTNEFAVASLITGALMVWIIVTLAT